MKKIALTVSSKRYEIQLDDAFADFVLRDLQENGLELDRDNSPMLLYKAYLRLAKQAASHENDLEDLLERLENLG
jgi:hypothetical protein